MSKALTLRLPDVMHERLRKEAFINRVSVNSLIVAAIELTDGGDVTNEDGSITMAARRMRAIMNGTESAQKALNGVTE